MKLKPSELGDLYFKAKTYDERVAERTEIEAIHEHQRPKFITVRTSFLLSTCLAIAVLGIWVMPSIFTFSIMAGAFAAIGFSLMLIVYVRWVVRRIIEIYTVNGKNANPFLLVYPLLLGCSVVLVYELISWAFLTNLALAGLLLSIHFVVIVGVAGLMRNLGRD